MKSKDARELFSAYLEGELSADEVEALRAHFARCPEDEAEYRAFETTVELTRSLPREEPGADFTDVVVARARQARHLTPVEGGRRRVFPGGGLGRVAALAAVLAVGFVSGTALLEALDSSPTGPGSSPAIAAGEVAGDGPGLAVASPDASGIDGAATDSVAAPEVWHQYQNAPLRQVRSGDENATVVF